MRLTRYILRMHIGPLLFGTFAVVFIFLLQFIFKFLNDLVGKGLSYWVIAEFIFYNLAWMLVLAVPMGVLVSTLMSYGKLSGNNELTIIKSAGGSAFKAMAPAIVGGAILFLGLYLFNDKILPETNHKAYVMQTDIRQFRPTAAVEPGQFSTLERYSVLAREVDRDNDVLKDVTIYGKQGGIMNVINAERAELAYSSDLTKILMTLRNGEVQRINQNALGDFRRIVFREYRITMNTNNQQFRQSDPTSFGRTDRTMNIEQMQERVDTARVQQGRAEEELTAHLDRQFAKDSIAPTVQSAQDASSASSSPLPRQQAALAAIAKLSGIRGELQRLGNDVVRARKEANKYLVEIHKKYAIPAACLIFVFVGAPLGIVVRRGNFGVSAVIALGFFVVYWACLVVGEKLADRDVLHPAIAMWLGDMVVGVLGAYLTLLVSRETVALRLEFPRLKKLLRMNQGGGMRAEG